MNRTPKTDRPLLPTRRRARSGVRPPAGGREPAEEREGRLLRLAERAGVLRATLDHMAQGISVVDADLKLIAWNQRFLDLLGFPERFAREHIAFEEFLRFNAERGEYGPGDIEEQVRSRVALARKFEAHQFKRSRPNGRVIEVRGEPLPGGGFVTTYTDVTDAEHAAAALRESEERFRDIAEFSNDWFWEQDAQFRFTYFSGGMYSAGLYDPAYALGKTRWDLPILAVSEADWREHKAQLAAHEAFRDFAYQIEVPNGELRWFSVSGKPLFAANGEFIGYRGTGRDITERRHFEDEIRALNRSLEERVRERTLRLEASNRELEAFSYSVSHDLRGPLRSIAGFSQVLREQHAQQLDAAALGYLERIGGATRRMAQLIDDMLALARLARARVNPEEVDLTAMATAIAADLATQEAHAVEFLVAADLRACADRSLMHVVLENLLRNAWKFTRHSASPRVELGCMPLDKADRFYVRDNGVGFDARYADSLFRPFQRLHLQDEYEGSGIGLATVQRIIAEHGGEVSAEGEPGAGACFAFTLPRRPPAPDTSV